MASDGSGFQREIDTRRRESADYKTHDPAIQNRIAAEIKLIEAIQQIIDNGDVDAALERLHSLL